MNKENNNVARRLGNSNYYKYGDKNMHSMSEEASGIESNTHQREGSTEEILPNYAAIIATLGATLVGTIIIAIIVSRMWNEDEIKLHILSSAVRILQNIARLSGSWAIECERSYNDHVNALH